MHEVPYEGPTPLGVEEALIALWVEELLAPLGAEEVDGAMPILHETGAFPTALGRMIGTKTTRGATRVTEMAMVGAYMIFTSSSL